MNHLLALLTAAACGLAVPGVASAMPAAPDLRSPGAAGVIHQVQLGGGGPVGGGPNGSNNGTGAGGVRGGVLGGTGPGTGAGGLGSGAGLRPNGANQKPNGSKPAPMRPNGVRNTQ